MGFEFGFLRFRVGFCLCLVGVLGVWGKEFGLGRGLRTVVFGLRVGDLGVW